MTDPSRPPIDSSTPPRPFRFLGDDVGSTPYPERPLRAVVVVIPSYSSTWFSVSTSYARFVGGCSCLTLTEVGLLDFREGRFGPCYGEVERFEEGNESEMAADSTKLRVWY